MSNGRWAKAALAVANAPCLGCFPPSNASGSSYAAFPEDSNRHGNTQLGRQRFPAWLLAAQKVHSLAIAQST